MSDNIIFIVGGFITLILFCGLLITVLEFRKMNRHPENYLTRNR